ncbi:MAG: glycosyltransferase family 2 protein [Spongiibacteraceae bacterium]|jgi:GT2 family glycosyltransferase|nr:glycosyltransferase family 2 protein [Spongiibacteraceae bacterium]
MTAPDRSLLTIGIVSYNSHQVLSACMQELLGKPQYRTLIIDNASTDQSAARLQAMFPDIEVIPLPHNIGYGRAANVGIAEAKTKYFLLLNPDLQITTADIDRLFDRALSLGEDVALLAPAVERRDYLQQGLLDRDWVIGAAMLFNLTALSPLGLFDENIFLFSEETDLCIRIRRAGLRIALDSDLFVNHLYRQSTPSSPEIEELKNWHIAWSNCYVLSKHGLATGKKHPYRLLVIYLVKMLTSTSRFKRVRYRTRLSGTWAFISGQSAFLPDGTAQHAPRRQAGSASVAAGDQ